MKMCVNPLGRRPSSVSSTCWIVALSGACAFFVAMVISLSRWPQPHMHDDFGNLLVASTLLEGRFSNPVPAAWQSMETFHVIFQPSYASKYPIGLGSMMAAGKLMFGSFAAGLWLSAAAAAASIAWMTLGYFPRRWGLATGMATATHPFWQNGWSQEFTNGWLAVAGIALLLGGLLRLRKNLVQNAAPWHPSLMIGLGCMIVLFSRPFEGVVVGFMLVLFFLPTILKRAIQHRKLTKTIAPALSIIALACSIQAVINRSVTGSMLQLPYQLHEMQYGVAPVLAWQSPHEPQWEHRFDEIRRFHRGWSMNAYHRIASVEGYWRMLGIRTKFLAAHWGQTLALAPLGLLLLPRDRKRFIVLIGLMLVAMLIINAIPWAVPQYVAPFIPVAIFLGCVVARSLFLKIDAWLQRNKEMPHLQRRTIERWAWSGFIMCQMLSLVSIASARSHYESGWELSWAEQRAQIVRQLESQPLRDVVFVRYHSDHDIVNSEWVFNEAVPSESEVVWVRWASDELNREVIRSYPGRKYWLLEFDPLSKKPKDLIAIKDF